MVIRTVDAISRSKSRSASQSSQDSRERNDSCSSNSDRYDGLSKTNIYICPIPATYSKRDLEDLFKKFGRIINSTILTKLNRRSANRIDGFPAFVDFEKHSAAKKAVEEYNGVRLKDIFGNRKDGDWDSRLLVRFADAKGKRPVSARRRRDFNDRRVINRGGARRRADWDRPLRFPRRRLGRRRSRSRSRKRSGRRSRGSSSRNRGRGRRSTSRSPRSRRERSTSSRSRSRSKDKTSSRRHRARYKNSDSAEGSGGKSVSRSRNSSEGSLSRKRRKLNSKGKKKSSNKKAPNIASNTSGTTKTEVAPKVSPKSKSTDVQSGNKASPPSTFNLGPPKTSFPTRPPPKNIMDDLNAQFSKVTTTSKLSLPSPSSSVWNANTAADANDRKKPKIKLPAAKEKLEVESKPTWIIDKKPVLNASALNNANQRKYSVSGHTSGTKTAVPKNQAPMKKVMQSSKQLEVKQAERLHRKQSRVEHPTASTKILSKLPQVVRVVKLKEKESSPFSPEQHGLMRVSDQSYARTNIGTVGTVLPQKTTSTSLPQELPGEATQFSLPLVEQVKRTSFSIPQVHQKKTSSPSFPQPQKQQKLSTGKINTSMVHKVPRNTPSPKNNQPLNASPAPVTSIREKIYPITFKKQVRTKTLVAPIRKPPVSSFSRNPNPNKVQHISEHNVSVNSMNTVVKTSKRTVELGPYSNNGESVATKVVKSKPPASTDQVIEKQHKLSIAIPRPAVTVQPKPVRTPQPKPLQGPQPKPIQRPQLEAVEKPQLKPSSPRLPPTKKGISHEFSVELPPPSPEKKVQSQPVLRKVRQTPQPTSPLIVENKGEYENEERPQGDKQTYSTGQVKTQTLTKDSGRSQERAKSLLDKNTPTKEVGPINLTKVPSKPRQSTELNTGKQARYSTAVHPNPAHTLPRVVAPAPKQLEVETLLPPVEINPYTRPSPVEERNSPDEVKLRSMNEKEEEAFQKFKKQKIRVAWQTYLQDKAQIRLLETKNDELEEDIKQMEGKCRYWKDMFERTLTDYRQVKSELRKLKARRLAI